MARLPPLSLDVSFSLKEIHCQILLCVLLCEKISTKKIRFALGLLRQLNFDFIESYRFNVKSLTDGDRKPKFDSSWVTEAMLPSQEEIDSALGPLRMLDLITIEPVYVHLSKGWHRDELVDELLCLRPEGQKIAEGFLKGREPLLRPPKQQQTVAFIACRFGKDDVDGLYKKELEPACRDAGLEPFRVDVAEPRQTITQAIISGIGAARCMIADLTYARPSVYFEIGLAQGLGLPMMLTSREDHHKGQTDDLKVHFDLEQFKISFWSARTATSFSWRPDMDPATRLAALLKK